MVAELVVSPAYAAWLRSPDVITVDGAVMSWVNPAHPGYSYPEIAGYMLSDLAFRGRHTAALAQSSSRAACWPT